MHWRRKWQPTPVFLPGESHGWRSLVGCSPWGRTESDTTEATQQHQGTIIPVEISIYGDRKFDFILKSPPASILVKKAVGLAKGTATPSRETVGTITRAQLEAIAKERMRDLNAK